MTMLREPLARVISAFNYESNRHEGKTTWVDYENKKSINGENFEKFIETCYSYAGWNHMSRQLVGNNKFIFQNISFYIFLRIIGIRKITS
jgi:hypothetical protein